MSESIRDKAAIVGIGQTEYVRRIGRSERETAHEASRAALADAGLSARDVDGIYYVEGQSGQATDLARRLGVPNLRSWAAASAGLSSTRRSPQRSVRMEVE